jgi:N-acetylglutamate synthase-like GNAT family acetyltransferase
VIRKCDKKDLESIYSIINDSAMAYKGVIPEDCWKEPYMPKDELAREISSGVEFWGYEENGALMGVMGIQDVADVALIRHAYVRTYMRKKGIGSALLESLLQKTSRPVLIGTWKASSWAVNFYKKHGFTIVSEEEKNRLLKKYWRIPARQIETSLVMADKKWLKDAKMGAQGAF